MKVIHKYPFEIISEQPIQMPVGAEVNHVGLDPAGRPCIWAIVDPCAPMEEVIVLIIGTGHDVPDEVIFLGTFVKGDYVWHTFIKP